jgi:hypothetical protein
MIYQSVFKGKRGGVCFLIGVEHAAAAGEADKIAILKAIEYIHLSN